MSKVDNVGMEDIGLDVLDQLRQHPALHVCITGKYITQMFAFLIA